MNSQQRHLTKQSHAFVLLVLSVILSAFLPMQASAAAGSMNAHSRAEAGLPKRVYGHSVIPGGVRGSSELTKVLERDAVVRAHYADFDTANAYVVHVKRARLVHVSYRMGDDIYWTKKTVRLVKGEALLTDGKSFVRARCGNRIADLPQLAVANNEPAPEELDTVITAHTASDSIQSNFPAIVSQRGVASKGLSSNAGMGAAPRTAGAVAPLPPSTPSSGPRARQTPAVGAPVPTVSELAKGTIDQITTLVPALAGATNNEVLNVLLATAPTDFAPQVVARPVSDMPISDMPGNDMASSDMPAATPTAPMPSQQIVDASTPISATLPDLASLPVEVVTVENPTEVPEPGSIALFLLALSLISWMRVNNSKRN